MNAQHCHIRDVINPHLGLINRRPSPVDARFGTLGLLILISFISFLPGLPRRVPRAHTFINPPRVEKSKKSAFGLPDAWGGFPPLPHPPLMSAFGLRVDQAHPALRPALDQPTTH